MEEKKEKKTIKCSYAVLVIILFAALAFGTDYAIIERKTSKCNCPKCEATNNEVISDNTDNTQVTENDASIRYLQSIKVYGNDGWSSREIILNSDGSAKWRVGGTSSGGFSYEGYYTETVDKIVLSMFDSNYTSLECKENSLFPCNVAILLNKNLDGTFKSIEFGNMEWIYNTVSVDDLKLFNE